MKLREIEINNFLSFTTKQKIIINDNLNLISGKVEGKDSSNGAGKSSLLESVYWCLTGKMVRDIKAASVIRHGASSCKVKASFEFMGKPLVVERSYGAKKTVIVWWDDKEETFHDAKQGTSFILNLLRTNEALLSLTTFYGKLYSDFCYMAPSAKAQLIDELIESGLWDTAHSNARKASKEAEIELRMVREKEKSLTDDIVQLEHNLITYRQDLKTLKETLKTQEREIAEELVELEISQVDELKEQDMSAAAKRLQELNEEIAGVREQQRNHQRYVSEVKQLTSEVQKYSEAAHNKVCYTCNQTLANESAIADMRDRQMEAKKKLLALKENAIEDIKEDELAAMMKEASDYKALIEDAALQSSEHRAKIDKRQRAIDNCKQRLYEVRNNSREAVLNDRIAKATAANEYKAKELGELSDKRHVMSRERKSASFWEEGFKDIRYKQFEKVLGVIQQNVNNFAERSGLQCDKIEFNSSKVLASGEKRSDVNVKVIRNGHEMDIGNLSEGEQRRLSLGVFFALNRIISNLVGYNTQILVLDEPLQGLDGVGKQKVFDALAEASGNKQIFVTDHDNHFSDLFHKTISVHKNLEGASSIL